MLPLRKFVLILFLVSVLPVTVILIMVKVLMAADDRPEEKIELVITPTLAVEKSEAKEDDPFIRHEIPLTLFAPVNGATVFAPFVTVKGKTVAYAQIAINEASSAADLIGNFVIPISLGKGRNPVIVTVIDENGRRSVMEISVIFDDSQIPLLPYIPPVSPSATVIPWN